jgi:hypothetical protein
VAPSQTHYNSENLVALAINAVSKLLLLAKIVFFISYIVYYAWA